MRIDYDNNSFIEATSIEIGSNFKIGSNVKIKVRNNFKIGSNCVFNNDVNINAYDVFIGDYFFHLTPGLNIGGGGSQFPEAIIKIGDRCVLHNNYINLAHNIIIGNDVGISPDVDILTHGFWNSALEGYPYAYKPVKINDGVILGQRSFILMGVEIETNCVIGANSTVTKSLLRANSVYAGNPARFIRRILPISTEQKISISNEIMNRYKSLTNISFIYEYPLIKINEATINLENKTISGLEDDDTDRFRDFIRRYGIKIYTPRGFKSL